MRYRGSAKLKAYYALSGFIGIIDGLVAILSLGNLQSKLLLRWALYMALKNHEWNKNKEDRGGRASSR